MRVMVLALGLAGTRQASAQSIDLLRGARTDLAASSVYRSRLPQLAALVDGDLETAWNSRTGELAGAWLEVRLPENATVTSIALTAGFTKRSAQSDLFTGNHRITSVRVLRAGVPVGVYPIDPESRALQTLPVTGRGGVYRLEIAQVLAGTRATWREVCISELRIMGTAPGAQGGTRFPRLSVGQLPSPRAEVGLADRAQMRTRLRDMTLRFAREWGELNATVGDRRRACALDESEMNDTTALLVRRQRFVEQVAQLVEAVDEVRADQLRAAAFFPSRHDEYAFLPADDHDRIAAGMQAVVDWLADDGERCRWASADATLRLRRAEYEIRAMDHNCEHMGMDYPSDEGPGAPPALVRQCRVVERALPRIEALAAGADHPRANAAGIARYTPPELSGQFQAEWAALQAELTVVRQACH